MHTKSDSWWSIDTNILVYATETVGSSSKQTIAKELLRDLYASPQGCLAGQVISEFMNVAIRKKAMTYAHALDVVTLMSIGVRILGTPPEAYAKAWELAGKYSYQMGDALIIAICAEHGIKTLYSEVAGPLTRPLGVHVINPFESVEAE